MALVEAYVIPLAEVTHLITSLCLTLGSEHVIKMILASPFWRPAL